MRLRSNAANWASELQHSRGTRPQLSGPAYAFPNLDRKGNESTLSASELEAKDVNARHPPRQTVG